MSSALYECRVVHERFAPRRHRFAYRVFAFSLDLDEIDALVARIPWLSRNRFNLYSFHDRDHLDVGNHHLVSGWRARLGEQLSASTGGRLPFAVFSPSGSEARSG